MVLGHFARLWIIRSRKQLIGYRILEKVSGQKDLSNQEQNTLEQIAKFSKLSNPGLLVSSIDAFDRAIAIWMKHVNQMPWMEMEEQVDRLKSIRDKLEFRYLSSEYQLNTTRELVLGQTLFVLAKGNEGFRLLDTRIRDLDDLAIWTDEFQYGGRAVKVQKLRPLQVYFWPESGKEYGFKTRIIKEAKQHVSYLMLEHGDSLETDSGRKIFSCDLNVDMGAEWVKSRDGRTVPSRTLLDDPELVHNLDVTLCELSGSGFSLSVEEDIGINDLIWLEGHPDLLKPIQGIIGRAVDNSPLEARFKFQNLSAEDRELIIRYVAPKISPETFQKSKARNSLLLES